MCCEYIIREEKLATNCDVEESPMGDAYSRGDRVGEPADQHECQTQRILCHNRSSLGGRQSLCAVERIFRPAKCRYISRKLRRGQRQGSYVIQVSPWHPPQALMSEYPTVLHLHKLESSTPLGPKYDCPDCSGPILNTAKTTRQ